MNTTTKMLEALQMQPLTEEEKASRHILGRLYGPIATFTERTRNDRKYNKELWEKALSDDIFNEKIKNKSLFLELGHPTDREETDMTKVCACIPEMPKIVDGDLCAYVDILDTTNGRLLKTLIDYGFIPGISSRGTGDLMDDNEVDPETFFLETWDIVQLPAVKKARLNVCESLDASALKLKSALTESYNKATDNDKKLMAESLKNLNLSLTEDIDDENAIEYVDPEEFNQEPDQNILIEAPEEEAHEEEIPEEETSEEDVAETEAPVEGTVEALMTVLQDIDKDAVIEIAPSEDCEYDLSFAGIVPDEDNNKVILTINCVKNTDDDTEVEPETEEVPAEDEVVDDKLSDVMASFKDMVRQKDILEKDAKALKADKAVSDAKVEELTESVAKYKAAFERVSEIASNVKYYEAKAQKLNEQLIEKDKTIAELSTKVNKAIKLNENVNTANAKAARLSEQLKETNDTVDQLNEQLSLSNKKVVERTEIARNYKAKFEAVMESYVQSKAKMLGVSAKDITSKLNENYTTKDVDKVCDELLESTSNFSRLPLGRSNVGGVRITESAKRRPDVSTNPDFGYDIDDSLLDLAGLNDGKFKF